MSKIRLIFEKQWIHASLLAVLLAGLAKLSGFEHVQRGERWGVSPLA